MVCHCDYLDEALGRHSVVGRLMEGIRQEDIPVQAEYYFDVEKMFTFGSFMRMICTNPVLGKNIHPENSEDREYLDKLCDLDLIQIEEGKLKATEMLAVYKKKATIDQAAVDESARKFLARYTENTA